MAAATDSLAFVTDGATARLRPGIRASLASGPGTTG